MMHITYDTETTGLNRWADDRMFAFSTCSHRGDTGVYRLEASNDPSRYAKAHKRLDVIWAPENAKRISKVMHNARFDIGMTMNRLGIPLSEMRKHDIHETMALSHLRQNLHKTHALDDLAWEVFGESKNLDNAVDKYKRSENAMLSCPEWLCDEYQHADAKRTMLLFRGFSKIVKEMGLWDIYEMERKLVWTTLAIEERGVMLSIPRCKKLIEHLHIKCAKALEQFQSFAGKGVSLTPDTLRWLFYTRMELPVTKLTPKRKPSVDKHVVKALAESTKHPIFEPILKYNAYSHGISTLRGYLKRCDSDGILHPNIHPYGTDTSRESCKNPNLQNVETTTRLLNPYPVPARKAFRPKPGYVNYDLDYDGVEVCGSVQYTQDPEFLKIILAGGDVHEAGAGEFYGERFTKLSKKRQYDLWKKMRDAAKNGDFCKIYLGGLGALSRTLGMTIEETRPGNRRWEKRFHVTVRHGRQCSARVRKTGQVTTFFGRILHVPRNEPNKGPNYEVQGGCAGLQKRAQIEVENELNKSTGAECGIILPVHDNLIVEVPRKRRKDFELDVLPKLVHRMTDFEELTVPFSVSVKVSEWDWETTKPVEVRE